MGSSEIGGPHLTIFYSGTVNVFDHVPADKAHAIMLLLSGCSNSHGSSAISNSNSSDHALLGDEQMRAAEIRMRQYPPNSNLLASSSTSNTVSCLSNIESSLTAPPAILPLRPPSTAPPAANAPNTIAHLQRTQHMRAPTRRRSQAELPFARKASLAHFLQKRKDRVEATKAKEAVPVVDADESPCKKMKL